MARTIVLRLMMRMTVKVTRDCFGFSFGLPDPELLCPLPRYEEAMEGGSLAANKSCFRGWIAPKAFWAPRKRDQ